MKKLALFVFLCLCCAGINQVYADTQNRSVSGFHAVELSGSFYTYLTQGSSESVRVDAPGDIINDIKTEVSNGELHVYQKSKNWGGWFGGNHKKVTIYISAKQLSEISQSGSGDLFFKSGISAPSLTLHVSGSGNATGRVSARSLQCSVSGSGNMDLNGRAENGDVSVSGSGTYNARDLAINDVSVRITGSGNATVNVSDRLDARVSGSGDVSYTGPVKNVMSSKSGSGDIHRL